MNIYILIVVLSGQMQQLAAFPNEQVCHVVATALNTHPENEDPNAFHCIKQTGV